MTRFCYYCANIIMIISLSACHVLYHPTIEQGNIITPSQIALLHPGMEKDQVVAILGYPVLVNLYENNHMTYVYTLIPGHGKTLKKQLTINFLDNHLVNYNTILNTP